MVTDPVEFPASQDLSVNEFFARVRHRGVDDPPELLLILDVTHEETMHEWRTQLRFSRQQFLELVMLTNRIAKIEGII